MESTSLEEENIMKDVRNKKNKQLIPHLKV